LGGSDEAITYGNSEKMRKIYITLASKTEESLLQFSLFQRKPHNKPDFSYVNSAYFSHIYTRAVLLLCESGAVRPDLHNGKITHQTLLMAVSLQPGKVHNTVVPDYMKGDRSVGSDGL
jgi:hypothetical protein